MNPAEFKAVLPDDVEVMKEMCVVWRTAYYRESSRANEATFALTAAQERERALKDAIRLHRDERGNDRCWLDDDRLYAVLGEGTGDRALPCKSEFLSNCARYWEQRQPAAATPEQAPAREEDYPCKSLTCALAGMPVCRAEHDAAIAASKDGKNG